MAPSSTIIGFQRFILNCKATIQCYTASPVRWFGLQFSEITTERVPMIAADVQLLPIQKKIARKNRFENLFQSGFNN